MKESTSIIFIWPSKQFEQLYKLLIEHGHDNIAGMYKGAVYLHKFNEANPSANPDASRQLLHSLREVMDKFGGIRSPSDSIKSKKNHVGDKLTEEFDKKFPFSPSPDGREYLSDAHATKTGEFMVLYKEFHELRKSLPLLRVEWFRESILEYSPRFQANSDKLDILAKGLRDMYRNLSSHAHSDDTNLSSISLYDILQGATDLLLDCFPDHVVDRYEDINALIDLAEEGK